MTKQQKQKLIDILERLIASFEELVIVEKYFKSLEDPGFDPQLPNDFDINKVDFNSDPGLDQDIDDLLQEVTGF